MEPGNEDLDLTFLPHSRAQQWQKPIRSQKAKEPTGAVHLGQPPGAQSKVEKGREWISHGQVEESEAMGVHHRMKKKVRKLVL